MKHINLGKIKPGDFILFAAVGSGWTWGAALVNGIKGI
jgi:3-oxoacyl-[acyl-carrier-protein] synthase III